MDPNPRNALSMLVVAIIAAVAYGLSPDPAIPVCPDCPVCEEPAPAEEPVVEPSAPAESDPA
jgi:hypothetical protein